MADKQAGSFVVRQSANTRAGAFVLTVLTNPTLDLFQNLELVPGTCRRGATNECACVRGFLGSVG